MSNKTLLMIAGAGLLAWWYFRTNRNRLRAASIRYAKNAAPAARTAGMGMCCPCPHGGTSGMGTLYSEDPITGPYGEINLFGDSGVVANNQGIWDRMEEASAL